MKTTQKGFAVVESLLITIIVLLIVFIGYYVWHSQQQTTKTLNSAQAESASTPSIKKTTSSSASEAAGVQQNYLTIKDWGVRAPYSGTLTLEFSLNDANSLPQAASFSSAQLDATASQCSSEKTFGGVIDRYFSNEAYAQEDGTPSGQTAEQYAATLSSSDYSHIGNYYYFYTHPQAVCGDDQSSTDLQNQTDSAVQSIATSLQAIPQ